MKTSLFGLMILSLFGLGMTMTSCNKEIESVNNIRHDSYDGFKPLLDKVHNLKLDMDPDHVVYMDVQWNKETNEVTVTSVEQKLPDFFPMPLNVKNKDSDGIGEKDAYQVDCCCDDQGHDLWNKTCDGKWSCGTLVSDCLDEGGCATICNATIIYMPQFSTYLVNLPAGNSGSTSP